MQDDAVEAIRSCAKQRRLLLGKAASELIRRGARYHLGTQRGNGVRKSAGINRHAVEDESG